MDNYKAVTFKGQVLRICLIAACVLLVVYMLPREKRFGFDFKVNKPWTHQQLIADYDFPIYKSEDKLKAERDSVEKLFQPYFTADASVGKRHAKRLAQELHNGTMKDMPPKVAKLVTERLHTIYSAGIVKSEDMRAMNDSAITSIRAVSGREAQSRKISQIFSTRTAYGFMLSADSGTVSHEQLVQYNLGDYIEANLTYDAKRSDAAKIDLMEGISPTYGLVQRGQKIIDRGEIVTPATYDILKSLEAESQVRNMPEKGMARLMFGQFLLVAIAFSAFFVYVKIHHRNYFNNIRTFTFMLTMLTLFPVVVALLPSTSRAIAFLVPFAMVGIFMCIFTDTHTSFLAIGTTVLTSSLALVDPFEFILVNFASGVAAIYALHDLQQRSQLFQTAVVATLLSLVTAAAFDLSQGMELKGFDNTLYIYLVINGVFLLFSYPMLYVVEKLFGFVSSVTLIELSNINNPLLRRLSKEAAGTFNHSMQVANLAADAASKIGARTLLVRTGALYHDIGKLKNPAFFTENQSGVNPHDQLSPESSANIIVSHVAEGIKLADKYHLPSAVKSFISTHHGKSKAKYFYITWMNAHPDEKPDEEAFSYPGPNPSTREQAILMMADSVEAASRSLKEYTEESISRLVDNIVDNQMKDGYFSNCPITFEDIADTKKVFVENLKTIYHSRIQYPELNTEAINRKARQRNFGNLFGNRKKQ
jgi:cyclic-di-AMP phosphodiesterase PgpH